VWPCASTPTLTSMRACARALLARCAPSNRADISKLNMTGSSRQGAAAASVCLHTACLHTEPTPLPSPARTGAAAGGQCTRWWQVPPSAPWVRRLRLPGGCAPSWAAWQAHPLPTSRASSQACRARARRAINALNKPRVPTLLQPPQPYPASPAPSYEPGMSPEEAEDQELLHKSSGEQPPCSAGAPRSR